MFCPHWGSNPEPATSQPSSHWAELPPPVCSDPSSTHLHSSYQIGTKRDLKYFCFLKSSHQLFRNGFTWSVPHNQAHLEHFYSWAHEWNIVVFTEHVSVDLGSSLLKPIAVNVIIYKPQHPDDVSSIFYGVRRSDCPLGHCDGGGKKASPSRKTVQTRREVTLLPRFGPICYGTKTRFQFNLVGSKLHRIKRIKC